MAHKWKCFFCNLSNEPNTSCLQCNKANIHVTNINQICLCGRKVTKIPHYLKQCRTCCKEVEKKTNTYYGCGAKQCVFRNISGTGFTVCNVCYESTNTSTIDSKHSFAFCKVASLMEQIRKETNECPNNDERRRYMFYVYQ
eukprot:1071819_1